MASWNRRRRGAGAYALAPFFLVYCLVDMRKNKNGHSLSRIRKSRPWEEVLSRRLKLSCSPPLPTSILGFWGGVFHPLLFFLHFFPADTGLINFIDTVPIYHQSSHFSVSYLSYLLFLILLLTCSFLLILPLSLAFSLLLAFSLSYLLLSLPYYM